MIAVSKNREIPWQDVKDLTPKRGDIIEFQRGVVGGVYFYRHVGIYVGRGNVVHKTRLAQTKGQIEESKLKGKYPHVLPL